MKIAILVNLRKLQMIIFRNYINMVNEYLLIDIWQKHRLFIISGNSGIFYTDKYHDILLELWQVNFGLIRKSNDRFAGLYLFSKLIYYIILA